MIVLEAHQIGKYYGSEPVLEEISGKIARGEKVGLIGENGCGKSTLLKLIAGIEDISEGTLVLPGDGNVGYLAQELQYGQDNSVEEEVASVFGPVEEMGRQLQQLEQAMGQAEGAALDQLMQQYGELSSGFEQAGGYDYQHRIETVLHGLRLTSMRQRPVHLLSGGEKNIVALAKILLQEPDILLLDEPANHLDFAGLEWLEGFLRAYEKTVVLVSHNRYLLDRVVGRIWEIEDRRLTEYDGNYSLYRAEKLKNLLLQKAAYDAQQKELRRMEAMVKRFEHWAHITDNERHARQARNKQKALDRIERIDRPDLDRKRIDPRFEAGDKGGHIALEVKGYNRSFGETVLFQDARMLMTYGERVGLLGANGSGKSTLFKEIATQASWDHPVLRVGPKVRLGYYSQEHETLDLDQSIIEDVRRQQGLSKDQAFGILSRFLFSWQDMDRTIGTLSGGEKSRVQLAKLMLSDANFLLLDEPTNHLDIHSRERVEEALEEFDGTILVISHDRYFLDRIVERVVEVDGRGLQDYEGGFSYYWGRKKSAANGSAGRPVKKQKAVRPASPQRSLGGADELEAKIEKLEGEKRGLEEDLAHAYRRRDFKQGDRLGRKLRLLEEEIGALYEAWEEAV
ncbi:MAG: ATP-binding cassette domain-containing protein [Candidatus Latescibacteria bacterium]|nr:ATP-binding cassette domain-containing protein [Candidatus Latescibacterota bacterium]